MKALLTIFVNECRAILRSKTLVMLLVASVGWMLAAPRLFVGDGTESGFRQMTLHYSLGGVAALLAVTLLISATGSIARERNAKRLALTMVRPVRYFVIALGKILAYVACGAVVLAVSATIEFARQDAVRCRHVFKPLMPSVTEEAEAMYADYMANTNTPDEVRQTKKSVVLRLLANRAIDRYDTIVTNADWVWKFDFKDMDLDPKLAAEPRYARFRFSTDFDQREDVAGELQLGPYYHAVSNITQAVIEVPLLPAPIIGPSDELRFRNLGRNPLMLRPRRDVEVLIPADSFGWNLFRAYLELVAMLALLISFGVFLGSSLGRPAALFTALTVLLLSEMAPSVVDNYVDELETDRVDAIGLAITRVSVYVTKPVSSLRPLEALSLDECVEPREVARILAIDLVLLPIFLAMLSALVMPRKQDF